MRKKKKKTPLNRSNSSVHEQLVRDVVGMMLDAAFARAKAHAVKLRVAKLDSDCRAGLLVPAVRCLNVEVVSGFVTRAWEA